VLRRLFAAMEAMELRPPPRTSLAIGAFRLREGGEMRVSGLGDFALSACAAAAMLAGCGGSQPPIGAPGAMACQEASAA
jgi:hypothetical protein